MSQQPEWELVANLGDVNFADYGGMLVYRDKTGVYAPEAEIYEVDGDGENGGEVYRFSLDPPRFKTLTAAGRRGLYYKDKMTDPQHRGVTWRWYDEWFVTSLPDVARSCGQASHGYLLRCLFSKDPLRRALAYQDIVGYFGAHEFDNYPMHLSEDEAQHRYAHIPRVHGRIEVKG